MKMYNDRKKLEKNIQKMYLLKFISGMYFFVPIIVLFWQENGLNLTQIMILQSLFSFMVVTLEIPSGYFADVFGRKMSILISIIMIISAIFI